MAKQTTWRYVGWVSTDAADSRVVPTALTGVVKASSRSQAFDRAMEHIEIDRQGRDVLNWYVTEVI